MFLVLFALIIAGFTALPLYFGFWPFGLGATILATLAGALFIYKGNDNAEEGLGDLMLGTMIIGCVWFGTALACIIEWIR